MIKKTLLLITILTTLFSSHTIAKENWDKAAQKRKSEYIYLEAISHRALEDNLSWADLVLYASDYPSENINLKFDEGYCTVVSYDDSISVAKGYDLMEQHFNTCRNDYDNNLLFGSLTYKIKPIEKTISVWEEIALRYPKDTDVLHYYAKVLYEGDSTHLRKALNTYDTIEAISGDDEYVQYGRIKTNIKLGDTIAAIKGLNNIIKPGNTSEIYNDIALEIYLDDLNDTLGLVNHFQQLLKCNPDDNNANLFYINALSNANDSIAMNEHMLHILNNNYSSYLKYACANEYIFNHIQDPSKKEELNNLMARLVSEAPEDNELALLYAAFLIEIKESYKALLTLERITESDPTNVKAWRQYILLCPEANDPALIDKVSVDAKNNFPDNYDILQCLGMAYCGINNYDKAIDCFHEALSVDPNDINTLSLMGDSYAQNKDLDSAYYYYDRSLQIDSLQANTLNSYAYHLSVNNGDLYKAEALSRMSLELEPNNIIQIETFAWIKFLLHEHIDARRLIDIVIQNIKEEDTTSEMYHHAGDIYFMTGDYQIAVDFWEKALKLEPDNSLLKKKVKYKTFFYE